MKTYEEQEEAMINNGERQVCSLLPIHFNFYVEEAINEIKETIERGKQHRES